MTLLLLPPINDLNPRFRRPRWTAVRMCEIAHQWHGRLAHTDVARTGGTPISPETTSQPRFDEPEQDPERWDGLS